MASIASSMASSTMKHNHEQPCTAYINQTHLHIAQPNTAFLTHPYFTITNHSNLTHLTTINCPRLFSLLINSPRLFSLLMNPPQSWLILWVISISTLPITPKVLSLIINLPRADSSYESSPFLHYQSTHFAYQSPFLLINPVVNLSNHQASCRV